MNTTLVPASRQFIIEWGTVMRLARAAAMLAIEEQRRWGRISDPENSAIILYTDDPTTAVWFAACDNMAAICKTSQIDNVCILMGEDFPPASHEAPRPDPELPRVAALYLPAAGAKCPRCRKYTAPTDGPLCPRCLSMVGETAVEAQP